MKNQREQWVCCTPLDNNELIHNKSSNELINFTHTPKKTINKIPIEAVTLVSNYVIT